jgi:lipopolysaccharide transport system ATP-binding protein
MSYAIKIEDLSKCYRISHLAQSGSLRDALDNLKNKLFNIRIKKSSPHSEASMPSIEEFWALKNISLEIPKGVKLGVLGHNGAGKSTLLKVLSHITEPTSGRVLINGRISSLLEVGTGFHSELSGRENIFLNGAILGMKRAEIIRKFDEIIAFSEIEQFIDTPFKRYSSGMQVRLAFSVAAHLEPEILILDEILAVGDIPFQKKCLQKMKEISDSGATVIFVNHGIDAIREYCNQAIVLEKGKLVLNTTDIEEAITRYTQQ